MNRGWRFCRFRRVLYLVDSSCSLVSGTPRFSMVFGRSWTEVGLKLSDSSPGTLLDMRATCSTGAPFNHSGHLRPVRRAFFMRPGGVQVETTVCRVGAPVQPQTGSVRVIGDSETDSASIPPAFRWRASDRQSGRRARRAQRTAPRVIHRALIVRELTASRKLEREHRAPARHVCRDQPTETAGPGRRIQQTVSNERNEIRERLR